MKKYKKIMKISGLQKCFNKSHSLDVIKKNILIGFNNSDYDFISRFPDALISLSDNRLYLDKLKNYLSKDKKLGYITSEIKTILKGASIYYFSDIIDKNRHKDFTKKILDSFLTQKEKDYLENGLRNWTLFKLPTSDK